MFKRNELFNLKDDGKSSRKHFVSSEVTWLYIYHQNLQDGEIGRKEADFVIIKHSPASPDHGSWWDQGAMVYLMEYKYSFVCESGNLYGFISFTELCIFVEIFITASWGTILLFGVLGSIT